MNLNKILLPAGGALLGYLSGDKDTALRNAAIGAAAGIGAKWLMRPALPAPSYPEGGEDLPPGLPPGLPTPEPQQESPFSRPITTTEQAPYDRPDYIPDTGEQEDWTGKDQFPVGASAILQQPFATSRNTMVDTIVKSENGNWVSYPHQEIYFESVGQMARDPRVHVAEIVDQTGTVAYWQMNPEDPAELQSYP